MKKTILGIILFLAFGVSGAFASSLIGPTNGTYTEINAPYSLGNISNYYFKFNNGKTIDGQYIEGGYISILYLYENNNCIYYNIPTAMPNDILCYMENKPGSNSYGYGTIFGTWGYNAGGINDKVYIFTENTGGTTGGTTGTGAGLINYTSTGVEILPGSTEAVQVGNSNFLNSSFEILKFLGTLAILAGGMYVLNKIFSFVPSNKE